jgi:hypothetical protein
VAHETRELWVGPTSDRPKTDAGEELTVPAGWALLPPGDAGLTRRVKAAGPTWTVREKRGRKLFSRGVWAPAATIDRERARLDDERADPRWTQRLDAGRRRRDATQAAYVQELNAAVLAFLAFAPAYRSLAQALAQAVVAHAAPVGSGTVARTQRIPVERRAEAAVIARLRHQTTEYDTMSIPRVKGMRREVRRLLADRSRQLLSRYRQGAAIDPARCVLTRALATQPQGE